MAGLTNTNENLNLFNEQVDRSSISVDRLGSALKQLSNVLPIQDVMKLQDSFANLNRTLALNSTEVTRLSKAVDYLATTTKQYSRVELTGMIASIAKSNSALSSNIANVEKLARTFSNAYKQGAPQFLQLYVKMNEALPQLSARTEALSDSVTTLNEVFKVGGKEGLSAYLASIGKISDETLKVEDTLSNSFKRLEKTFTDFKTKVGESTSGALKSVVDFAGGSELGMLAVGAGSLAAGKFFGGKALGGLGRSLGITGGGMGGGGMGGNGPTFPSNAAWANAGAGTTTHNGWSGQNYFGSLSRFDKISNAIGNSRAGQHIGANAGIYGAIGLGVGQSLGNDTIGGRLSTGIGAALTGFSVGGPTGALVGAAGASATLLAGDYQQKKIEKEQIEEETLALRNARDSAIKNRARNKQLAMDGASLGLEDAEEGSAGYYRNLSITNSHMANSLNSRDPKNLADITSLREKARELAVRGYSISSSEFSSEASQMQVGLGFDPTENQYYRNSKALGALNNRSNAIDTTLSALTAGGANNSPEEVARLEAEKAQLRQDRLNIRLAPSAAASQFYSGQAGLAGSQASGILASGGSLDSFMKSSNEQKDALDSSIKQLETSKKIALEEEAHVDALKISSQIQDAINQKTQIELAMSAKIVRGMDAKYALAQKFIQLGTLKGADTALAGLMLEQSSISQKLADEKSGKIKLSEDDKFRYSQRLEEIKIESPVAQQANRLAGMDASRQSFEIIQGAAGAMGADAQLTIAKQKLEYLKEELNTTGMIDKNVERINKANQKSLEIQMTKVTTFGKERQQLDFESDMNEKKLRIAQLTKNPFIASKLYRDQIEIEKSKLVNLNKELELATKNKADPLEIQNIERKIGDAKVNIAEKLDFQRRTFAEQFTEQTINMPTGSYLFPGATSEAQNLGSAYYEGNSNPLSRRPKGAPNTYQGQVAAIFGEGTSERSDYASLAGSIIDGLSSNDTVLNVRLVDDKGVNTQHKQAIP